MSCARESVLGEEREGAKAQGCVPEAPEAVEPRAGRVCWRGRWREGCEVGAGIPQHGIKTAP